MHVLIPSALTSYTARQSSVEASGATVDELLLDLDRQFPGLRFRVVDEQDAIRPHMRVFVNRQPGQLTTRISPDDEIAILMALSGG